MNKSLISILIATFFVSTVIISCKEPSAGKDVTKTNESDTTNYLLKGKVIATETQKKLAKTLQKPSQKEEPNMQSNSVISRPSLLLTVWLNN
ncbi:MAG: hypothetical protein IPP79_21345 [Chitinophagaceae bacterium]|nr:hypothetical protein [Chitinophagaceae bacterium]